jgi:hypothetical protein
LLAVSLVAAAAYLAAAQAPNAILVEVQFDNTLDRVQNNIKTVNKYMAEKLCKVPVAQVVALKGKDESSLLNHQSKVQFYCIGADVKKLQSNCGGWWNRHELKDEIKDHTTPDIEVDKVISCTPTTYVQSGRKMVL